MNNKDEKTLLRTTKDLQSFAQTIRPLTQTILGKNGFVAADVITHWGEIVGEQLAGYSAPLRIEFPHHQKNNGCLYLQTNAGAFALEIKHREKYILDKINTYFGYKAVSSLKILQNGVLDPNPEQNEEKHGNSCVSVSQEEEEIIKNLTNDINNQNLKEILIKLGHSVFADNHKKEKKDDEI